MERDILNRLHAINQDIVSAAGIGAARQFWTSETVETSLYPILVPLPGRADIDNRRSGTNNLFVRRTYTINIVAGNVRRGIQTETAQADAYTMLDNVFSTYNGRKRLELNDAPLANVNSASITGDSGFIVRTEGILRGVMLVSVSLLIAYTILNELGA